MINNNGDGVLTYKGGPDAYLQRFRPGLACNACNISSALADRYLATYTLRLGIYNESSRSVDRLGVTDKVGDRGGADISQDRYLLFCVLDQC